MHSSTAMLQESQQGGISTTTTTTAANTTQPCTTTTTHASMKRPSSSSSPLQEPSSKKRITLQNFTKLALPIPFPSPSAPPSSTTTTALRRTISEPIYALATTNTTNARPFAPFSSSLTASSRHFLNPQVQENNTKIISSSSPQNATTHGLLRSISDPTSLSFGLPTRNTPNSQKLEKMKDVIKGISEWCEQIMHEDEDEDECEDDNKKDCDSDCEDDQEAVSIERNGECVEVHFSCPCGKGYQILLAGNNCYYKLM